MSNIQCYCRKIREFLFEKKLQKTLRIITASVLIAILMMQLYKIGQSDGNPNWKLSLLLYVGFFCFFLGVTGRYLVAATLTWVIIKFVVKASLIKFSFLRTALQWEDLYSNRFADVAMTIAQYPDVMKEVSIFLLSCFVLLVMAIYAEVARNKNHNTIRICIFLAGIFILVLGYNVGTRTPAPFSHYGFSLGNLLWSKNSANSYLEYRSKIVESPIEVSCPSKSPNMLIILEESTFYPVLASDFKKYFRDTEGTRTFFSGNLLASQMNVHTFGGGTYLSEFSFFRGLPRSASGANSEMVYSHNTINSKSFSLPNLLKSCNYKTIVLSAESSKKQWSNHIFYPNLGFEEHFIFEEEELDSRWRLRPDAIIFNKIKNIIRQESGGKPLLIYAPTVSQHGPYDSIEDYMNRVEISAQAFNDLGISLGSNWIYGWFGDHQPNLDKYIQQPQIYNPNLTFTSFFSQDKTMREFVGFNRDKAIDISFMAYVIAKNLDFKIGSLGEIYEKALRECQNNIYECSTQTKNELDFAYAKYVFDNKNEFKNENK